MTSLRGLCTVSYPGFEVTCVCKASRRLLEMTVSFVSRYRAFDAQLWQSTSCTKAGVSYSH